jgi:endonuclease/exonuclease/phosphatase family metal-dependent hydrolase
MQVKNNRGDILHSRNFDPLLAVLVLAAIAACVPDSGGPTVSQVPCQPSGSPREFTVATYNIHAGVGRDGSRDLHRIAETLAEVDLAALQEVDNGRLRSRFENQVRSIATALGHRYWQHFPAVDYWPFGTYGVAATSSLSVAAAGGFDLPVAEGKPLRRLAWIKFLIDCRPVHVFIIHVTRTNDSPSSLQAAQIEAAWRIISEKAVMVGEATLLMGDFNVAPDSDPLRWLGQRMTDVLPHGAARGTAAGLLDHIFVWGDFAVLGTEIRDNGASDHPAVVATLQWKQ